MKYLKGDWAWYKETSLERVEAGFGKETFVRYTLKHKLRLLLGMHGQQHDGSYCYGNFDWVPSKKLQKKLYRFMFKVGNPILNRFI